VLIKGISDAITNVAHNHRIVLQTPSAGKYTYWTAVQTEDTAYPTPYTPTERAKDGVLNYPFEMPEKFTVMFWVRPWFKYDTETYHRFVEWFIDDTHRLIIYYHVTEHKIYVYWQDGGTARVSVSQQFDDGTSYDDINQWIMVALAFDAAGGQTGSRFKVYADTIGEDTDFGGALDAKTSSFPTLSIGQENGTKEADSFISDLLILPNQLLTAEQMDRHYWKTRPWHSPGEVASFDKSVRIDRSGIRLHNAELNITDWRNRQILISNRDGLMAKDAAGKIIHDVADVPLLVGRKYLGHIFWFIDNDNYVLEKDNSPAYQTWEDVLCLTDGIENASGGLFMVFNQWQATIAISGSRTLICSLRPKGSTWSPANPWGVNVHPVPYNLLAVHGGPGEGYNSASSSFLICPLGPDNKIQYYIDKSNFHSEVSEELQILQLGVLV